MKIIYDTQLILLGIYIALNALIVGYYWNRTYLAFWIAVFFLIAIWCLDLKRYGISKGALIITSLIVAFQGPLLENIMISLSGDRCWVYGDPFRPLKTSLFLFPGYGIMGASSVILYSVWRYYLAK